MIVQGMAKLKCQKIGVNKHCQLQYTEPLNHATGPLNQATGPLNQATGPPQSDAGVGIGMLIGDRDYIARK